MIKRSIRCFGLALGVVCVGANAPSRQLQVVAHCDPCRVEFGKTAIVFVEEEDAGGDALAYRWAAAAGAFADRHKRRTTWTAPDVDCSVPVTVAVSDGRGGSASDTIRIRVVPPAPVALPNRDAFVLE